MSSRTSRRALLRGAFGLATTVAITPILAACGGTATPAAPSKPAEAPAKAPDKPAAAPTTAAATGAGAAASKSASGAEIVYLNQSRGQAKAMGMLAEQYTQKTGVKVTIDSPGPIDYPKKLQAASQANTMPDAYYAIGAADMAPYYKAGFAVDLAPELDKGWNKNFQPSVLELAKWRENNALGVKPGIYQAHWEANTYAMLYNPAHFEKAKLDPQKPATTTTEWLTGLTALKSANIGPFAIAFDFIYILVQAYVSNWLTDEEIDATQAGRSPWQNDAYKQAVQLFADLRDGGLIFNNSLNASNPDIEKSFFNVQELASFYTGSFSVPVQVTTAPEFTAYLAAGMPKAADSKLEPRPIGAGGKNGVVNAKGPNVEESLKFVRWATEKEQEEMMAETVPLVPANPQVDQAKIQPQLQLFARQSSSIQLVTTPRTGPVNEAFTKGVQSLLLKEMTVDQVLAEVDKAQKG
jgi:raffinose/stachyose/melibiose transport system substrate-binding protein